MVNRDPVLVAAAAALGDQGLEPGGGSCLDRPRDGLRFLAQATGLDRDRWEDAQAQLARACYEHKWADLACGELVAQVSIGCLEHGNLLAALRGRFASALRTVGRLYSDALWHLDRAVAVAARLRLDFQEREAAWARGARAEAEDKARAVAGLEAEQARLRAAGDRARAEGKERVRDLADTLRTLNKIFGDMKGDGEALGRADLNHKLAALEERLAEKDAELAELRVLKKDLTSTKVQIRLNARENEQLKEEHRRLTEEVRKKDRLLQGLLERAHRDQAEIEAMRYKNKKNLAGGGGGPGGGGPGGGGGGEGDESEVSDGDGDGYPAAAADDYATIKTEEGGLLGMQRSASLRTHDEEGGGGGGGGGGGVRRGTDLTLDRSQKRAGGGGVQFTGIPSPTKEEEEEPVDVQAELGTSVLCVRCRKELNDLNNIREALAGGQEVRKLQCYAFRLLLPNLKGHRPPRRATWVRAVMRAILKAKARDDALLAGAGRRRTRFPEFVFAWFEPSPAQLEAATSEQLKNKLIEEADHNRWGLYYGAKALARESAEAKLFWALLDESFGEDYCSFFLYCLTVVEGCAGAAIRAQWGGEPADRWCTLQPLLEKEEAQAARRGPGYVEGALLAAGVSGREVVWVELRDAQLAAQLIMVKAFGEYTSRVQETVNNLANQSTFRLPGFDEHPEGKDPYSVDLHQWLRVIMHSYKEEQVDRKAAIRLMFETASTGVLTDEAPAYGARDPSLPPPTVAPGAEDPGDPEDDPSVDLPQFVYIVRTLCKRLSLAESAALFREAHDGARGRVRLTQFLAAADRAGLFTRALRLPPFFAAEDAKDLTPHLRWSLGALVHRHLQLVRPRLAALEAGCPEPSQVLFRAAREDLEEALRTAAGRGGGNIDGVRPLAAFRRFMNLALHARTLRHEAGEGFSHRLREGGRRPETVVLLVERELRALSAVLVDFTDFDRTTDAIDRVRALVHTTRIQRTWRKRLWREQGPPTSVLVLMRAGYMRGRADLRRRRVHRPPRHTLAQVAECFQAFALANALSRELFLAPPTFPQAVFMLFVHRWGLPELAERQLHDLFYNARLLAPKSARVRLFCAFLGLCFSNDDKAFTCREGLMFYLRAVACLNRLRADPGAATAQWHPDDIQFPETVVDDRDRPRWQETEQLLGLAARKLCARDEEGAEALARAAKKLPAAGGADGAARDADEFLLAAMQHWRKTATARRALVLEVVAGGAGGEAAAGAGGAGAAPPHAQLLAGALDRFRRAENSLQVLIPMALGEFDLEYLTALGLCGALARHRAAAGRGDGGQQGLPGALAAALQTRAFLDFLMMGDFLSLKWELSAANLDVFVTAYKTYMPLIEERMKTVTQEQQDIVTKRRSYIDGGEATVLERVGAIRERMEVLGRVFRRVDTRSRVGSTSSALETEDDGGPSRRVSALAGATGINSIWRQFRQLLCEVDDCLRAHARRPRPSPAPSRQASVDGSRGGGGGAAGGEDEEGSRASGASAARGEGPGTLFPRDPWTAGRRPSFGEQH